MPMSVNMFRLRLITDLTPRTKNGQPAHRMTGVPSASSTQSAARSPRASRMTPSPTNGPIVSASSGTVSTAPIQRRRLKSTSSGFGPSSGAGTPIGSRAMPQIGHSPGPSRTISGCMGQVYLVPAGRAAPLSLRPSGTKFPGSAANLS